MFHALNMELEIVRTVLQNEVNDIYVCTDVSKNTGVFYTMISISSAKHRKYVAEKMNTAGLFLGNKDFVGSFIFASKLNLIFHYYQESILSIMGSVYLYNFADCKEAAIHLIAAFAEAGVKGEVGTLLLDDRNLNITKEGSIQLNYFIDFQRLEENIGESGFLKDVAEKAFSILSLHYQEKYQSEELYPDDLRLYYYKIKSNGFSSLGQMITTIRGMSDKPIEMRGILWWFRSRFTRIRTFLFRNAINTFLTILVIVTLIYLAVQLSGRIKANKAFEKNVSYFGIEYIGDVYLGDEE